MYLFYLVNYLKSIIKSSKSYTAISIADRPVFKISRDRVLLAQQRYEKCNSNNIFFSDPSCFFGSSEFDSDADDSER